jgi:large subunit ribosomal protein L25
MPVRRERDRNTEMAEIAQLEVQPRKALGTTAARRLRCEGIVPGNIFGHKQDATPIQVAADPVRALLHKGARLVDITLEGKSEKALVSEVQWDTFARHLIHIDFMRVDANERVKVKVPVHLRGTAPGIIAGGVLEQPHHEVTVECLAIEVPNEILVKIGNKQIGDFIHVKELTELPQGVHIVDSPETVLVHITQKRDVADIAPVAEGGPAEPEVIGKKKEGEEAAEKK